MKGKRHQCFVICLVLGAAVAHGQDFRARMLSMRERLNNADRFQIHMDVSIYDNTSTNQLIYHDKAEVNREGNKSLYRFNNSEYLVNDNYIVIADKSDREIVISKRTMEKEGKVVRAIAFNIDSILTLYESPGFVGEENGVEHFRVVQKTGAITQIDLFINSQTSLLQQMEYRYDGGQFVRIKFDRFDLAPAFESTAFDESKFVRIVKGKIRPSPEYFNYRVANEQGTN